MTNPTPGPWRTGDMFQTVFGQPNGPLTIVAQRIRNRSDARLIAAAPALLEALEALLWWAEPYHDDPCPNDETLGHRPCRLTVARAAIAAAREVTT